MHAAPAIPGWPSLDPLPGAAVPQRLHTPEAQPVAWWKVQQEAERRAAFEALTTASFETLESTAWYANVVLGGSGALGGGVHFF